MYAEDRYIFKGKMEWVIEEKYLSLKFSYKVS